MKNKKLVKIIIKDLVYGASLMLLVCFVFPRIWEADPFTEKMVCVVIVVDTVIHIIKDVIRSRGKDENNN